MSRAACQESSLPVSGPAAREQSIPNWWFTVRYFS